MKACGIGHFLLKNNMNFEDFVKQIDTMSENDQFSFGLNWIDYVKSKLTDDIIHTHMSNLSSYYKDYDFTDKSVLDIGCGSGLSSLSFNLLGCKQVDSIDVDTNSVEACNLTKEKFFHKLFSNHNWNIKHQSILNDVYVKTSKKYDIVYSWGVLHHTGDMWKAIKNATSMVNDNGILHLALYISGDRYMDDLKLKVCYNANKDDIKKRMIYDWLNYHYISRGIDINSINSRGMNKYNDCIDWLGGYPYEVCDPDILDCYLKEHHFEKLFYKGANQGGNFICLYKKSKEKYKSLNTSLQKSNLLIKRS